MTYNSDFDAYTYGRLWQAINEANDEAARANQNAQIAFQWQAHAEKLQGYLSQVQSRLEQATQQLDRARDDTGRWEKAWWAEHARRHLLEDIVQSLVHLHQQGQMTLPEWMGSEEGRAQFIQARLDSVIAELREKHERERAHREEQEKAAHAQAQEEYQASPEFDEYRWRQFNDRQIHALITRYREERSRKEIADYGRELSLEERIQRQAERQQAAQATEEAFLAEASEYTRNQWSGYSTWQRQKEMQEWLAWKKSEQAYLAQASEEIRAQWSGFSKWGRRERVSAWLKSSRTE